MFVVGHFHFTMAAASFRASFAALYFWLPKMFGRSMSESLGKVHFWITVVAITLVFGGQLLAGYSGQHRRLYDPVVYQYLQPLRALNRYTSYAAFGLFLHGAWTEGRGNPWQVATTTSPSFVAVRTTWSGSARGSSPHP